MSIFGPKIILYLQKSIAKLTDFIFEKYEFCENWDFRIVIFVKNVISEMWILWKIRLWKIWILWKMTLGKCEFCVKWDFEKVNFAEKYDNENVNFVKT